MARRRKQTLESKQLSGWKKLKRFRQLVVNAKRRAGESDRQSDPRRILTSERYFSLMLFGLLNPVVDSMRGLCEASRLKRFEEDFDLPPVSLGSFSEAQSVFDPELLRGILRSLSKEVAAGHQALAGKLDARAFEAIDSTLWHVLPRMGWAHWRDQGCHQNAVRLHLKLRLIDHLPSDGTVTVGKTCERKALREGLLSKGCFHVGDRYYSEDYSLLEEMAEAGGFLVRLRKDASIDTLVEHSVPVKARQAGITHDCTVQLGERNKTRSYRLVRLVPAGGGEPLLLLSTLSHDELGAWELCEVYRLRWKIELFFRWLKCLLPCRHWFAESPEGVAIQVYCALICALLLAEHQQRKPTKRQMELIRLWLMGWADEEELAEGLKLKKSA